MLSQSINHRPRRDAKARAEGRKDLNFPNTEKGEMKGAPAGHLLPTFSFFTSFSSRRRLKECVPGPTGMPAR